MKRTVMRIPLIETTELAEFFNSLRGISAFPRTVELSANREGEAPCRVRLKDQGNFRQIQAFMVEHMKRGNIYFRVPEHIGRIFIHLHALCVNMDFPEAQKKAMEDRLTHLPYPPSCIVSTGGGVNLYWFLSSPLNLQNGPEGKEAWMLLRWLAQMLDGHQCSARPNQLLRVPFTLNWKYQPPRRVLLQYLEPGRKYLVKNLHDWLRSSRESGEGK